MTEFQDIWLASASPRRQELLQQIGVRFSLLSVAMDETPQPNEAPEVHVLRLALEKARAGRQLLAADDSTPVLGADTVVVSHGKVLGKPIQRDDAQAMLLALSGERHQVLTAVALVGANGEEQSRLSVSTVQFRVITPEEAAAYWESGEPADKAGSYAIQGIAAIFIERLEGSYSGVMGLPLFETAELLQEFDISLMEKVSGNRSQVKEKP
jgi:septum formation protein